MFDPSLVTAMHALNGVILTGVAIRGPVRWITGIAAAANVAAAGFGAAVRYGLIG